VAYTTKEPVAAEEIAVSVALIVETVPPVPVPVANNGTRRTRSW
jgi:hypothetical protein